MFEGILRRHARYIPITPSRVVVFLLGTLIISSTWLYYLTRDVGPGSTRYLIYDNPGKLDDGTDPADIAHNEIGSLKSALILGYLLNRTVILPDFHCAKCQEHAEDGRCTRQEWSQCGFDSVYNLEDFHAQFSDRYEMASFLSISLNRKRLDSEASPLYVIDSVLTRTRSQNILPRDIVVLQPKKPNGNQVSTQQAMELLQGTENYDLLRFHSLYFTFDKSDDIIKINAQLSKAFKPLHSDGILH